ncbi:hypothetical protein RA210_U50016 [Rubrivivax sp. A210]|uniref:hypothetical protein n=1 Tax=Rubrivivax sp. A210 TaxID=2772301 RepID=UPI001917C9C9|nr:hypothetical protein [Rubrivivax sp. A210]CAD5374065.1 hypothetical protein RA210_U50016 [Rubrivivax sp. A210]
MTADFLSTLATAQPLAWLQQALMPAPRPTVRAPSQKVLHLRKGDTLVIETATGHGVVCLEGALCIVHDEEPSQVGVAAGMSRMTVRALANSRLCLPAQAA